MEEKNKKAVKSKPKTSSASKTTTVKKTTTKPVKKATTTKKVATKPVAKKTTKAVAKKPTTPAVKKSNTVTAKKTAPKKVVSKPQAKVEPKKINPEEEFAYKKYIYYVGLIALSFILIISIYDIATFYSFKNKNYSYLLSSGTIDRKNSLKLDDAKTTLNKVSGGYFIYISSTQDTEMFKLEKQMTKLIKKYDIEDRFFYINIDDILSDENYIERINYNLGFSDAKITRTPTIVYVNKDKELLYNNIINDRNGKMNIGDFQKLLDMNGFTEE